MHHRKALSSETVLTCNSMSVLIHLASNQVLNFLGDKLSYVGLYSAASRIREEVRCFLKKTH